MTLTKIEEVETVTSFSDPEQILHLKRLLVTLKQQYERGLQQLNGQLQKEQAKVLSLAKKLDLVEGEQSQLKKQHEEELDALRKQIIALRELSKQLDAEEVVFSPELEASRQRIEQLERVIPYLRERNNEANLETEQLRDELSESRHLNEKLSSILQEKETSINLQLEQHIRNLNTECAELMKEKVNLEHQILNLHTHINHQSKYLIELKIKLQDQLLSNKANETLLLEKERSLIEKENQSSELKLQIKRLENVEQEKKSLQERYESLQEEWKKISLLFEKAQEVRIKTESQLNEMERTLREQLSLFNEKVDQYSILQQEKERVEAEFHSLKTQREEAESCLKIAQQHLAKKVKEATLLTEKIEQMQFQLNDNLHKIESYKSQTLQLQATVDQRQGNESRLQDQLKDTVKNFELQNVKWEEKYYKVHDRWQECENRISQLQKVEEKHYQMQNILSNLGSFISGNAHANTAPSFASLAITPQQAPEKSEHPSFFIQQDGGAFLEDQQDLSSGHFDLFGMQINRQKSS